MDKQRVLIYKTLVIGIILLFICMSNTSSVAIDNIKKSSMPLSSGNTLYVGGSGPDNYTRIQDAIDNASSGDTVFVFGNASPYHENVVVGKSIFLIGEDKNMVVIDADFKGMAVTITASNVFVSGFTMIHPIAEHFNEWESALVDIVSTENVTIRDNIMQQNQIYLGDWRAGIVIRSSSYCFIQNNTIIKETDTRPSVGIAFIFGSTFNNVSGNEIYHFTEGIYITKWSSNQICTDNVIYMNYLHHNGAGIRTVFGNDNKIINNIINFNIQGIRIEDGCNNVVFGNIVTDNGKGGDDDWGIGLIGGSDNYVSYNHILNNNPSGIYLLSYNNNITLNNISKNKIGVFVDTNYGDFITRNNFIFNKKNGYFDRFISIKDRMIWDKNYWNRPRLLPYPIFGIGYLPLLSFPWVVFDWHPAQEPYDIPI